MIARGERVVRISTRLMAGTRRQGRERGKSDQIDAIAVARAALAAGIETLPTAARAGPELDLRLLVDHRERLSGRGWRSTARCSGTCTTSGQSSRCRAARCSRRSGRSRSPGAWRAPSRRSRPDRPRRAASAARSDHHDQDPRTEITELVTAIAHQLVAETGCGPLTAAKLVGEIAGADRFASDDELARAAGIAPILASSGRTDRTASTAAATANRRSHPPHRHHPHPLRPKTHDYIARRRPKARPTATPPLPQTPPRPPVWNPLRPHPTTSRNTNAIEPLT